MAKTLEGIVALVTVPIVLAALGQANYGFYLLIGQTLTMVGALDFGISPSIGLLVARYRGVRNDKAIQQTMGTSLLLLLVSSLVALIFTGALILNFARVFFRQHPVPSHRFPPNCHIRYRHSCGYRSTDRQGRHSWLPSL